MSCNCATCSEFEGRHGSHAPPDMPTLAEALEGMEQNIRRLNKVGPRAVHLRDTNIPASLEAKHADQWLVRFKLEKRHWEEYRGHYRLILRAHPEWAELSVDEIEKRWRVNGQAKPVQARVTRLPREPGEDDDKETAA